MTDVEQTRHAAEKCWAKLKTTLKPEVYRYLLFEMLGEEIRKVERRAELAAPKRKEDLKDLASKMRAAHVTMALDPDY
ncbi:hypothetical protein ACFL5Q_07135 [Planctomycetota bacterium]